MYNTYAILHNTTLQQELYMTRYMNKNYRPLNALISQELYNALNTRSHQLEVSKAHIVRAALNKYLNFTSVEESRKDVEEVFAEAELEE